MGRIIFKRNMFPAAIILLLFAGAGLSQETESQLIVPRALEGEGAYSHALALVIDGRNAESGSAWNGENCVFWEDEDCVFMIDLGRVFTITGLRVQVDGNDDYLIGFSNDGEDFTQLLRVDRAWGRTETGMETWSSQESDVDFVAGMVFEAVEARYLRIEASGGDSSYALAEFQAMGYEGAAEEGTDDEAPAVLLRPVSIDAGDSAELEANRIIDGIIPPEGSGAHAAEAVFWDAAETVFTVDLGAVCEISGMLLQVDGDDDYHVDVSIDREDFFPLLEITGDDGEITEGLDTMSSVRGDPEYVPALEFFPVMARYVRIYGTRSRGGFALSEVQFFGHPPEKR